MVGGYIFRVLPNQFVDTYYHHHRPDNITRQGYNLPWLTRLRISALVYADLLSAFALFQLMNYLTDVWNLSITHAAGIINIFGGITATLIIVFSFFADALVGELYMLLLSSIAYSIGLVLLSLSTPTFFGLCHDYKEECIGYKQKVKFFTALPLIAVGMAGHFVALPSFIETGFQTENEIVIEPQEQPKPRPIISKIRDIMILVLVIVCGGIAPSYEKAYSVRFGVPAICTLTATLLFLSGVSWYKDKKRDDGPLKVALRVFTAAAFKDFQQVDQRFTTKFNIDDTPTSSLRWLDRAATKFPDQEMKKSWTLCTMREIEDTKTGIRMIPMLLTLLVTGLVFSLVNTYFVAQANHMNNKLGRTIKIQIPFFLILYTFSSNISQLIHNYALSVTCIPRKYFAKMEIGIGMVLTVLCCIIAAIVETQRLRRSPQLMSVFFVVPQSALVGCGDGIIYLGIKSFLEDQHVLELNLKYLLCFPKFVLGLGSMANVLWVYLVEKLSERNSSSLNNWFQHSLNDDSSRLDRYYWTLAGLSAANLVIYVIVASLHEYNKSANDEDAAKYKEKSSKDEEACS